MRLSAAALAASLLCLVLPRCGGDQVEEPEARPGGGAIPGGTAEGEAGSEAPADGTAEAGPSESTTPPGATSPSRPGTTRPAKQPRPKAPPPAIGPDPEGHFELAPAPAPLPAILRWRSHEQGAPLRIVVQRGHIKAVRDLVFTPDGRLLLTLSEDRTVKIWSRGGELLRSVTVPRGGVRWLALTAGGQRFAVGCQNAIYEFGLDGRQVLAREGSEHDTKAVAISPDGRTIVTSDGHEDLQLRGPDWQVRRSWAGHESWIHDLAFTPDGQHIVAVGGTSTTAQGWKAAARLWSRTGEAVRDLEVDRPAGVLVRPDGEAPEALREIGRVAVSPDGALVALLAERGGVVHLRRLDDTLVRRIKIKTRLGPPFDCRFAPDGRSLLVALKSGVAQYDLEGNLLGQVRTLPRRARQAMASLAVSPDGERLATGYRWEPDDQAGVVDLWDGLGRPLKRLHLPAVAARGVSVSSQLDRLVLELERGARSLIVDLRAGTVTVEPGSVGFYASGEEHRFSYKRHGREFKLTDDAGPRTLRRKSSGQWIALTPQGRTAYIPWPGGEITWYDRQGTPVRRIEYKHHGAGLPDQLRFSPDGSYFVLERATSHGGHHEIALFDTRTGQAGTDIDVGQALSTIAVGPESQRIATGHESGDIQVFSRQGKRLATLTGHTVPVTGLTFSADGQYFISSSEDRTVRLWDLRAGRTTLTLIVLPGGDWAVYDPQGRFDCSDGGRALVRFVRGLSAFRLAQIWDDLFTPGLVPTVLQGATLARVDVERQVRAAPQSSLRLVTRSAPGAEPPTATLEVCARAGSNGVGEIFLRHDGRTLDASSRGLVLGTKTKGCRRFVVPLTPGLNRFTGAAYDRAGVVYGRSATLDLEHRPPRPVTPDLYLLAVGVSGYRDTNLDLKYAAADATALARALGRVGQTLYGHVHDTVLTDRQATRAGIVDALARITAQARPMDAVVLFLAGHGEIERERYYFLAHDADITDLKATGLSVHDLEVFARRVPANKLAIFLDTCKSGGATRRLGNLALARGGLAERRIIARLAKERGIAVFAAAATDQAAFEIAALAHGIFTHCLLDVLAHHLDEVASHDLISTAKLLGAVNRATRETAREHLQVEQSPILYMFGDDFSLGRIAAE